MFHDIYGHSYRSIPLIREICPRRKSEFSRCIFGKQQIRTVEVLVRLGLVSHSFWIFGHDVRLRKKSRCRWIPKGPEGPYPLVISHSY